MPSPFLSCKRKTPLLILYSVPERFWALLKFALPPDDEYNGEYPENHETNDGTNEGSFPNWPNNGDYLGYRGAEWGAIWLVRKHGDRGA